MSARLPVIQHVAHPRVSGENDEMAQNMLKEAGSSPRERGKRGEIWEGIKTVRLIPA